MLIDQPTLKPTRKVAAGGIASLVVIAVAGISRAFGYEIQLDVETVGAVIGIISFVAAWFTREKAE